MNCAELNDHYELYAMGIAEEPERSEIEAHLARDCEVCRASMRRAVQLTTWIGAASAEVRASGKLRRRILQSVGVERRSPWAWLWAAAATAALVAAIYIGNQWKNETRTTAALRRELQQQGVENARLNEALAILSGPDTAEAAFGRGRPTPPRGRVFVNPRRGVLLIASNLPPAPRGKMYEMWMIPRTGTPIPAGLFQSQEDGNAVNIRPGGVDLAQTTAVAVTVENEGGAPQPTSQPFIVAALSPQ
ncbi:MAG TPA: anti-sigma factor [Bryobacteraceae bacterium]|nr:anti-sigma factor [Bryobacteraceae bacterium]